MPRGVDVEGVRRAIVEQRLKGRAQRREGQVVAPDRRHSFREILEVLIDRDSDRVRLLLLQPGQRTLVVLVGRGEQVHARPDDRQGDEQREHGDVLGRERCKPSAPTPAA